MKQWYYHKLYQHKDYTDNKNKQGCPVHTVHEPDIGIGMLIRIPFLQK